MKVRVDSLAPGAVCRREVDPEFPPPAVWEIVSINTGSVTVCERPVAQVVEFTNKRTGQTRKFTATRGKQYTITGSVMVEVVPAEGGGCEGG